MNLLKIICMHLAFLQIYQKPLKLLAIPQFFEKTEINGLRGKNTYNMVLELSRKQKHHNQVYYKNKKDFLSVTCGVTQGSILGPILSLLYVKNLSNASKFLEPTMFQMILICSCIMYHDPGSKHNCSDFKLTSEESCQRTNCETQYNYLGTIVPVSLWNNCTNVTSRTQRNGGQEGRQSPHPFLE